jgi:butyryl-CoA dehydrogenase
MFDFTLNETQRALRDEVRDFVKSVPRQLILDMDADKIDFPRDFLREAGRRNLMGCRYPKRWGGRGLDWVTTAMVMEEVGVLGYIFACTFGVGAELVCDAIVLHGTDAQKEKYVAPLLRGELFAAECLTEPRSGSDFFGTTTVAEDRGDHFLLKGQKRFIVGGTAADYFLVYARTDLLFAGRSRPRRLRRLPVRTDGLPGRGRESRRVHGREGPQGESGGRAQWGPRRVQHHDDP